MDESYDIPRSHQLPYVKSIDISIRETTSASNLSESNAVTSKLDESRPDSSISTNSNVELNSTTLPKRNFYTNAAPTKVEGNVFRYDFDEKV